MANFKPVTDGVVFECTVVFLFPCVCKCALFHTMQFNASLPQSTTSNKTKDLS